ncbi:hypothetical protein [Spirosoma litoris]
MAKIYRVGQSGARASACLYGRHTFWIYLAISISLLSLPTLAQPVTVSGTVKETDGTPLPGQRCR